MASRTLTVVLPDFASMSDDEVQAHVLARHRDGKWSYQTRGLLEAFATDRLELNEAWAENWIDWKCPVCNRHKVEIARLTDHDVLLCQLDYHHDHLGDHASAIMRAHLPADLPDTILPLRKRAIAVAVSLVERFSETLLCNDCNAADGAMKAQLGKAVPSSFSFRPSEIARFIRPQPHRSHDLNLALGAQLWEEAREDFDRRNDFAKMLGAQIASGHHDCERTTYGERQTDDSKLFFRLGSEAATARNRVDGLSEALLARSRSTAGRWSAGHAKPAQKVQVPSASEFAKIDAERSAASRWWRDSGADWRCPCCDRSKFEIMRRSRKGGWTAMIMVTHDFDLETNPASLARRAVHHEGPIVLRGHRQIGMCQDCRQILSDALTIRPGTAADCLSLTQIRALAANPTPHARHAITAQEVGARIDSNGAWLAGVTDYWCHQRQASDVGLEHYRMMCSTGLTAAGARDLVIPKLVKAGQLPEMESADWFDWWMEEDERMRQLDRAAGSGG